MTLTTTLNRLQEHGPCTDGWAKLLRHLGADYNPDAPINLLTILESNGVQDCLWALRATEQDCAGVARLMACDFAEAVLPIHEAQFPSDPRPRQAIETARRFARGAATREELAAAGDAAWAAAGDAARAAAWAAAGDAARAAAWAAAGAAAWAAAGAAAGAAAWAAARAAQAAVIRRYLAADAGEGR